MICCGFVRARVRLLHRGPVASPVRCRLWTGLHWTHLWQGLVEPSGIWRVNGDPPERSEPGHLRAAGQQHRMMSYHLKWPVFFVPPLLPHLKQLSLRRLSRRWFQHDMVQFAGSGIDWLLGLFECAWTWSSWFKQRSPGELRCGLWEPSSSPASSCWSGPITGGSRTPTASSIGRWVGYRRRHPHLDCDVVCYHWATLGIEVGVVGCFLLFYKWIFMHAMHGYLISAFQSVL